MSDLHIFKFEWDEFAKVALRNVPQGEVTKEVLIALHEKGNDFVHYGMLAEEWDFFAIKVWEDLPEGAFTINLATAMQDHGGEALNSVLANKLSMEHVVEELLDIIADLSSMAEKEYRGEVASFAGYVWDECAAIVKYYR